MIGWPILVAVAAQSANVETDPGRVAAVMDAATTCALAANKNGTDQSKFEDVAIWTAISVGGFQHSKYPISVSFPSDSDGVSRICEVHATMASQKDQRDMVTSLEVLLHQKSVKQSNSMLWLFGKANNVRGLQFYPDKKSEQPDIRFVGAAF